MDGSYRYTIRKTRESRESTRSMYSSGVVEVNDPNVGREGVG